MRFLFLAILGSVIAFSLLVSNRHRIGKMLQYAGLWAIIFVVGLVAAGLFGGFERPALPRQAVLSTDAGSVVEVPRSRDGHYHMVLQVNGAPIRFIVDTGATELVLTKADAEAAGLDFDDLRFLGRAQTANGEVRTAHVRLDEVGLADIVDKNVRAVVNEGAMRQSLLGMSYLSKFGRIEIEGDQLRLIR